MVPQIPSRTSVRLSDDWRPSVRSRPGRPRQRNCCLENAPTGTPPPRHCRGAAHGSHGLRLWMIADAEDGVARARGGAQRIRIFHELAFANKGVGVRARRQVHCDSPHLIHAPQLVGARVPMVETGYERHGPGRARISEQYRVEARRHCDHRPRSDIQKH